MTEREGREGTGKTKDNVKDDLDEAAERREADAAGREEAGGGSGGVKSNVTDDLEKTQDD